MPSSVMQDWLEPSEQRWPEEDGPWLVRLHWDLADGSVECVGLDLRSIRGQRLHRIESTTLRKLPIGRLIRTAKPAKYDRAGGAFVDAYRAAEDGDGDGDGDGDVSSVQLLREPAGFVEGIERAARPWQRKQATGRPRHLDGEHFRAVARVYSEAVRRGDAPRQAIVGHWHTTGATASRWIGRARELGFLPATVPGRAKANLDLTAPGLEEGR